MTACAHADDAYLVELFPSVVLRAPERWQIQILDAVSGDYVVTVAGVVYPMAEPAVVPPDTTETIRNHVLAGLGVSMDFAASAAGLVSVLIDEEGVEGLDVEVEGPAEGTISATLIKGGDTNAAQRALFLEAAKCGLPPCPCGVDCAEDFRMMHAALAAFMILYFGKGAIGQGGQSVGNFKRMRLGPAELEKLASSAAKGTADEILLKNGAGELYLLIRSRYVFGVACA